MSTSSATELNEFPSSDSDGTIFYVPTTNISGTSPLYRLYDSSSGDHMDSTNSSEGAPAYQEQEILGYPWSSSSVSQMLLWQLIRTTTSGGGRHATQRQDESLPGYTSTEPLPVWGLKGWNNVDLALLSLTAGGVTIQSNTYAGGALYSWTWNGGQFINTYAFGRYIQSDIFYTVGSSTQNPNEAGDGYGPQYGAEHSHGSSIINETNTAECCSQVTSAVPFEFSPQNFGGGANNPVVYPGVVIGKEITLNFDNLGPVARYIATVTVPFALTLNSSGSSPSIEVPSGYVQPTIGPKNEAMSEYYVYDVGTGAFANVTSCASSHMNESVQYNLDSSNATSNCSAIASTPSPSGYAGVIISTASQDYAMGAYAVGLRQGGSASYLTLWDFNTGTEKWSVVYGPASISYVDSCYASWIMTGTVSQVKEYMLYLYQQQIAGNVQTGVPNCFYNGIGGGPGIYR